MPSSVNDQRGDPAGFGPRRKTWTEVQAAAFLKAVADDRLSAAWQLSLHTIVDAGSNRSAQITAQGQPMAAHRVIPTNAHSDAQAIGSEGPDSPVSPVAARLCLMFQPSRQGCPYVKF